MKPAHLPVLYQPVLDGLQPRSGGRYLDGTLGAGGHAAGILARSAPDGQLLGLDVDPRAVTLARQRLAVFGERAIIRQASYLDLRSQLDALGWATVDGILLDLGVSSMQVDEPGRGFSFRQDAPLDMRFGPHLSRTAADLVNDLPEEELVDLLWRYGEERAARRIARAVVAARPVRTTRELADLVARVKGAAPRGRHPATQTFQALRIAVNDELQAVEKVLPLALAALRPGGRLAVIAFHSLEDRLVKQFFQRESRDCLCPPRQPVCTCGHRARLKRITRKPIRADEREIRHNPRARSARLRIAEKIA